ncbi:alpha,alpha-trehalase nth1 [Marasmius tenuissimus]|uniref:Endonuclease III homolog n=1 Tax=Marasmius tenuissimus TaxID=585030 RepID=A0ABR2ZM63_9AGAR
MAPSSLRRSISTRSSTRLATKASLFNSSVTLFELDTSTETETERPTKRVKLEEHYDSEFVQGSSQDLTPLAEETPKKRKKARKTTSVVAESKETILASPSPSKTPRKQKPIRQSLEKPHPAPENWQEVYEKIREMRRHIVAPVDTMGCDQAQSVEQNPQNKRFTTLVSLMLSAQTKDEVTDAAVSKLRTALGGSISVNGIIEADESTISEAINKVGFWRRKSQYIKQTAIRLRDDFESEVPKTVDELCSLPGVGPKMAFLALQVAWNLYARSSSLVLTSINGNLTYRNHGIGVDVHVHRITNRLGWHKPPTKNPEETRLNLQSWLPKELHAEINYMLVGFGQMVCVPIGPRCDQCVLSQDKLCPSAQAPKAKKMKKIKVESEAVKTEVVEESGLPKVEIEYDSLLTLKQEETEA